LTYNKNGLRIWLKILNKMAKEQLAVLIKVENKMYLAKPKR